MKRLTSVAIFLLLSSNVIAQGPATGFPPYGTFSQGQFDSVNLGNLNVVLSIPIASIQGRGMGSSFSITYNTSIYQKGWGWSPISGYGWSLDRPWGTVLYDEETVVCEWSEETAIRHFNFSIKDRNGTVHPFSDAEVYSEATQCGFGQYGSPSYMETYASDGSGYYLIANFDTDYTVFSPSGVRVSYYSLGKVFDTNGNYTEDKYWLTTPEYYDSIGRVFLRIRKFANYWQYEVMDATGTVQRYTLNLASFNIKTNFACGGVPEHSYTWQLPTSIVLPNGRSYNFTYEDTPGWPGYTTARLKHVTLPTGGYYEYVYPTTGTKGIECDQGTTVQFTRNVNDGSTTQSWQYGRVKLAGDLWPAPSTWKTTVTPPQLPYDSAPNQSTYTISRIWNASWPSWADEQTDERQYQGYEGSGQLLRLVTTFRDYQKRARQITTTLENGLQSKIELDVNADNQVTEKREYDWGSGAPGPLLRRTTNTYLSGGEYDSRKIRDRLAQTLVKGGSGNIISRTDVAYDSTSLTCVTGAAHHDDTSYGCSMLYRGNPTSTTGYTNAAAGTGAVTSTAQYDSLGNLINTIDPQSHPTTLGYADSWANAACAPVGGSAFAYVTSVTNALSHVEHKTYYSCTGSVASVTDPNNQTTTFTYDFLGRPVQTNNSDGGQTTIAYNDAALTLTSTIKIDASQNLVSTAVFDGLGRVKQSLLNSDPQGVVYTDTTYDALGRASTVSNPYRSTQDPTYGITTFQYDALGRVTKVIPPDSNGQSNFVSAAYSGNTTTVTDQAGKQRRSYTDALGRLIQVDEPNPSLSTPAATTYQYDALDNLTSVVQSGSRQRAFVYNSLSQLTSSTNPESGTITYAYDADGNLQTKTDARGVSTTYSYDALHRLTLKSYSDGTLSPSYVYDLASVWGVSVQNPVGRLVATSASGGAAGSILSYDAMGRLVNQWTCLPSSCGVAPNPTQAEYDLAGNLKTLYYPSGRKVKYSFNAASRLTQVNFDSFNGQAVNYNYLSAASYAPHGAPSSLTLGNGIVETTSYNNRLQPTEMRSNNAGLQVDFQKLTYAFNHGSANNGNVASITDQLNSGRTQTFTYDELNRIKTAQSAATSGADCWGLNFSYDIWANLTGSVVTKCSVPALGLTINAQNRIADPGFGYDSAGNLTAEPGPRTYQYDAENRMTTLNSGAATYTYDAEGQRVRKQVGSDSTEYIYFGGQVIAERAANGDWSDYVYAGGRRLARADSYEDRIRTYGDYCSNCGWQWSVFMFQNAAGYAGYVIQTGDKLLVRQNQSAGARGGPGLWFSDGSYTYGSLYDQDGQLSDADGFSGFWHYRRMDLSAYAGKAISMIGLITEGWTTPGNWEIYYQDFVLVSADGTVRPIYTRQKALTLSVNGSPESTRSYEVNHVSWSWGPDEATTYYHGDHLGSSRLMSNSNGYPTWQATYLPFGQEWNPQITVNNYKFTDLERDSESSLDHTWFRQLSSQYGRWLSADPLGGDISNPQSFNRYAYTLNNPVNLADPLGLLPNDDPDIAVRPCEPGSIESVKYGCEQVGNQSVVCLVGGMKTSCIEFARAGYLSRLINEAEITYWNGEYWSFMVNPRLLLLLQLQSDVVRINLANIIKALQKCGAAGNAAARSAGNDLAQMQSSGHIKSVPGLPQNAAGNTTFSPGAALGVQTPTIQVPSYTTASDLMHEWIHKTQVYGNPLGFMAVGFNKIWSLFNAQGQGPLDVQADRIADTILRQCSMRD